MSQSGARDGMIEAGTFAKLRDIPEAEILELLRTGALIGEEIDGTWYVDRTELHAGKRTEQGSRVVRWWVVLLLLLALPVGLALLRYGTLSPCGMLKVEAQQFMTQRLSKRDQSNAFGLGLGLAFSDRIVDGAIGGMSPIKCTEALVRVWSEGNQPVSWAAPTHSSRPSIPQAKPLQPEWYSSSRRSPIDDSTNVYLSIDGDRTIFGSIRDEMPSLNLRCKENKTSAFISFGMQLKTERDSRYNRFANLRLRYDDTPAELVRMDLSTNQEAVFFRRSIPAIKKMLKHKELLVEATPYRSGPQVTTFDLTGLGDKIGPLQTACHWR